MDNNKEEIIPVQPQNKNGASEKGTEGNKKPSIIEALSVSLPKRGGAVKSIAEKFSVNAVNGTSSFGIPIPVSGTGSGSGIFGPG